MKPAPQALASLLRWSGLLVLAVLLGACGRDRDTRGDEPLHVPPRVAPARHGGAGDVVVVRGDTLYGIAFRNGMDFRELAAINHIVPPYTIYVGQTLRLSAGRLREAAPPVARETPRPAPPRQRTSAVPSSIPLPSNPSPVANAPRASEPTPFETVPASVGPPAVNATPTAAPTAASPSTKPPRSRDVAAVRPPPPIPSSNPTPEESSPGIVPDVAAAPRTPSAAILPADVATVGGIRWRWPAAGSLLARFMPGDATKQGIDIAGRAGDPVVAAADGVVVYSGSGLVGYGELVIIKHSDEWLSAYGHNRRRLVQEGQRVRAGQAIAEMGSTGATRDELHFEIRRNGRPVDPLQYLPGR